MLRFDHSTPDRRFSRRFDKWLWALFFAYPFVLYAIHLFRNPDALTIANFFSTRIGLGINSSSSNIVQQTLIKFFELPAFNFFNASGLSGGVSTILTWFVFTELAHLVVDIFLFVVRIAHKWLDGFIGD